MGGPRAPIEQNDKDDELVLAAITAGHTRRPQLISHTEFPYLRLDYALQRLRTSKRIVYDIRTGWSVRESSRSRNSSSG